MKRLSLPNYISRSGAGFEAPDVFLKSSKVVDTNADTLDYVGIPIAQIDKDTYATTKEELHCFVIGESGCGKTRRVIMPTIRLMAKTGESMVISDPKGELYKYTADSLKKRGYDVKVLILALPDQYIEHGNIGVLRKETGIDSQSMTERIIKTYKEF